MNEDLGPVNPNIISYPLTKKEERSVGLVMRMTDLDREHAIEFVRILYYQIRTAPGGAEGLIRESFPNFLKGKYDNSNQH